MIQNALQPKITMSSKVRKRPKSEDQEDASVDRSMSSTASWAGSVEDCATGLELLFADAPLAYDPWPNERPDDFAIATMTPGLQQLFAQIPNGNCCHSTFVEAILKLMADNKYGGECGPPCGPKGGPVLARARKADEQATILIKICFHIRREWYRKSREPWMLAFPRPSTFIAHVRIKPDDICGVATNPEAAARMIAAAPPGIVERFVACCRCCLGRPKHQRICDCAIALVLRGHGEFWDDMIKLWVDPRERDDDDSEGDGYSSSSSSFPSSWFPEKDDDTRDEEYFDGDEFAWEERAAELAEEESGWKAPSAELEEELFGSGGDAPSAELDGSSDEFLGIPAPNRMKRPAASAAGPAAKVVKRRQAGATSSNHAKGKGKELGKGKGSVLPIKCSDSEDVESEVDFEPDEATLPEQEQVLKLNDFVTTFGLAEFPHLNGKHFMVVGKRSDGRVRLRKIPCLDMKKSYWCKQSNLKVIETKDAMKFFKTKMTINGVAYKLEGQFRCDRIHARPVIYVSCLRAGRWMEILGYVYVYTSPVAAFSLAIEVMQDLQGEFKSLGTLPTFHAFMTAVAQRS